MVSCVVVEVMWIVNDVVIDCYCMGLVFVGIWFVEIDREFREFEFCEIMK